MKNIFEKIDSKEELTYGDCLRMLEIKEGSEDFYKLIGKADNYARITFQGKGVIFAQIGLDATPCTANCKFCNFAIDNFNESNSGNMPEHAILENAKSLIKAGANEIFIMTTAQYDKTDFLEIAKKVRTLMPEGMRLVANTSDFGYEYAIKLKEAGVTGVYHICRLKEGVDTDLKLEDRINTIKAINKANLELYYCVEPIGPEHTNEEIADEIFRAMEYNVNVMAVMRRICFSGSPLESKGEISALKLAHVCAVATLVSKPKRAMGVHEPEIISLVSGANQIYAENGSNPRDLSTKTEQSRGFSVADAQKMLKDSGWTI